MKSAFASIVYERRAHCSPFSLIRIARIARSSDSLQVYPIIRHVPNHNALVAVQRGHESGTCLDDIGDCLFCDVQASLWILSWIIAKSDTAISKRAI